jgi:hypothetical protein
MTKNVQDIEEISFIYESKLSINYDINYEGIYRKLNKFISYWKESFELLKIYFSIFKLEIILEYQKMNLYLYKKMLDLEIWWRNKNG